MNLILKPTPVTQAEKEKIAAMVAQSEKYFLEWMMPFYKPHIAVAMERGWKVMVSRASFWATFAGLRVMLGGDMYEGKRWLHVSASRDGGRIPNWGDMVRIKELFLGEEVVAISLVPKRSEWINDTTNVLHLWVNLDEPTLIPDFRIELPGGKKTI